MLCPQDSALFAGRVGILAVILDVTEKATGSGWLYPVLPAALRNRLVVEGSSDAEADALVDPPEPSDAMGPMDALMLFGCLLTGLTCVAIFFVGLTTVARWISERLGF